MKGDVMDKKSFDMMKNGYNRYQVDDYVASSMQEKEEAEKQLAIKDKMIQELEEHLDKKQKAYDEIVSDLNMKERAANEIARIAMKEANMIVETAHKNADAIIKESLMMARGILVEIARIANEANEMKGSMKEELHMLLESLDEFETPKIPDMDLLKKE